jgi:hypothetical protein
MIPEQQQIALAEACGWKTGYRDPEAWHPLPDFLNNLNAMRKASDTLNADQQWQFIQHLNNITRNMDHNDPDDWFTQNADWIWRMVNATASQRAEAFLRTIGKWEESK